MHSVIDEQLTATPSPDSRVEREESIDQVVVPLKRLSPRQQEVLRLRF